MKKQYLLGVIILGLVSISYAQNNVGIGTQTPNSQSVLEIKSEDKGILVSRLTTIARTTLGTALTLAEDGMLVYDKDLTVFYYWDGPNSQWVIVGTGAIVELDGDPTNEIELPTGGANGQVLTTDGAGNYSWITDSDHDWYKVGGTNAPDDINNSIFTQGNVGIGTTTPSEKLEIANNPSSTGHNLALSTLGESDYWSIMKRPQGYANPDNFHVAYYDGAIWNTHLDILPNGNVGVNIPVPAAKLDINGDLRIRTIPNGASTEQTLVVDGAGFVKKIASPSPAGEVITFAGNTAPAGFLMCDGSAVDRTTYANLFAVIGTTYGAGNGTSTFNLPDLRGEFIRGFDAGRGIDTGRALGTWQKGSLSSSGNFNSIIRYQSFYQNVLNPNLENFGFDSFDSNDYTSVLRNDGPVGNVNLSASSLEAAGVGVARPRNISMNYCIRF